MGKTFGFIASISVGLVIFGFQLWLLFNASSLAPANPEALERLVLKYVIALALVFSLDTYSRIKTEKSLFNISIVKGLPKYVATLTATIVILRFIGGLIRGTAFPSILSLLSADFVPIIIANALIIAIAEEQIFRGFFANELSSRGMKLWQVALITSIAFGLFHWSVDYGNWVAMGVHTIMGLMFFYVSRNGLPVLSRVKIGKERPFGASPDTQMTNAGFHGGWNLFVLGFIR
jgi:membrane protease YdiL (CAAX protease family)